MSKKIEEGIKTERPAEVPARKITIRKLDKIETTGLSSPDG
jgi:hypothetical protein